MSRQASQDRITIPHVIRKVKKIVILKCIACNWTNFSFQVRADVLLESNDGFFFDRHLSRAHINKYKGQQRHIFFLAGCLLDLTNLLLYNNVFQIPYKKRKDQLEHVWPRISLPSAGMIWSTKMRLAEVLSVLFSWRGTLRMALATLFW